MQHYSERLVKLSRLNTCLDRRKRSGPARNRDYFRLPPRGNIYACPQMLFKFHPAFDEVLAGVLRGDRQGTVVIIDAKYPQWRKLLEKRWSRVMPDVADRIRFLPRMPRSDFLELLALADVMLDPYPFGGGHTSYEALSLGLPVVTLPGKFLRGRLTYAMYEQMQCRALIAASPADYVHKALRLATDARHNQEARRAILDSCGVLFHDRQIVRELENFWEQALRDL